MKAMREEFLKSREAMELNQEHFSSRLYLSERSYVDLEGGKSLCSLMTFLFFVARCHPDPVGMLSRLVKIVDQFTKDRPKDVVSRRWMTRLTPEPVVLYKGHGVDLAYPICKYCNAPIARSFRSTAGNCGQSLDWSGFTDEPVPTT